MNFDTNTEFFPHSTDNDHAEMPEIVCADLSEFGDILEIAQRDTRDTR